MSDAREEGGFLSRWARRKAEVRTGTVPPEPARSDEALDAQVAVPMPSRAAPQATPHGAPHGSPQSAPLAEAPPPAAPMPTLDDVALLTRESDYSRFVAPGVDGSVRNAAMKKLFTDPHFNVMDGLDTYIDDYGKPDPIPPAMLRMMRQSSFLGLFDDEKKEAPPAASAASATPAASVASARSATDLNAVPGAPLTDTAASAEPEDPAHEDTDLRLQQDDAAGRPGADQGAGA